MPNELEMSKVQSILALRERGWSCRRIARELGVHRETVARHLRRSACGSKPANPLTGSEADAESKPANPLAGSVGSLSERSGPASGCEPLRAVIIEKLDEGLTAQRIYQDLVTEQGFRASYTSVQRYVRRLREASPRPFRRMECDPGAEDLTSDCRRLGAPRDACPACRSRGAQQTVDRGRADMKQLLPHDAGELEMSVALECGNQERQERPEPLAADPIGCLPEHHESLSDGLVVDPRAAGPGNRDSEVETGSQDSDRVLPVVPGDRHELIEDADLRCPR